MLFPHDFATNAREIPSRTSVPSCPPSSSTNNLYLGPAPPSLLLAGHSGSGPSRRTIDDDRVLPPHLPDRHQYQGQSGEVHEPTEDDENKGRAVVGVERVVVEAVVSDAPEDDDDEEGDVGEEGGEGL
jgi:hypothetical protein